LAFLKQSRKDSASSKDKLKKREAPLLNSYNLRNVVNNSLSLSEVLTFYFGSAVGCPDILMGQTPEGLWKRCVPFVPIEAPFHRFAKNSVRYKFDVYANVNIL